MSVIVPCRDEAGFIKTFLANVQQQDYTNVVEIIVAEGGSKDATRQLLDESASQCGRIKVIDNPIGTVPVGLNAAIEAATGEIIVRMDVHTRYAEDYIEACVKTLIRTGAANVGGPWVAVGDDIVQQAIAAAFQSAFSSGGALSHDTSFDGKVDSVYLGCWYRKTLIDVGMFDEELVRNQDDELNLRLVRRGLSVWQSPNIRSTYSPRSSIGAVFKQYFQYGYWKMRVLQKHKSPAAIRHVVPGLCVVFATVLAVAALFYSMPRYVLTVLIVLYFSMSFVVSLRLALSAKEPRFAYLLPIIFLAFHSGYAFGSISGFVNFIIRGRGGHEKMTAITR